MIKLIKGFYKITRRKSFYVFQIPPTAPFTTIVPATESYIPTRALAAMPLKYTKRGALKAERAGSSTAPGTHFSPTIPSSETCMLCARKGRWFLAHMKNAWNRRISLITISLLALPCAWWLAISPTSSIKTGTIIAQGVASALLRHLWNVRAETISMKILKLAHLTPSMWILYKELSILFYPCYLLNFLIIYRYKIKAVLMKNVCVKWIFVSTEKTIGLPSVTYFLSWIMIRFH